MKSILMATDVSFWRREMGNHQRISSLCRFLIEQGHQVHVFYAGRLKTNELRAAATALPGLTVEPWLVIPTQPLLKRVGRKITRIAEEAERRLRSPQEDSGNADSVGRAGARGLADFADPEVKLAFENLCRGLDPDCVIVQYVHLAYLVRDLANEPDRPLLIVDAHDVMADRHQSLKEVGLGDSDWISITLAEECRELEMFDYVMAITSNDETRFESLLVGPEVITVTHAPEVLSVASRREHDETEITALFVAGRSQPNLDAIRRFLKDVWPKVRASLGDSLTLEIAGGVCDLLEPADVNSRVRLVGRFKELSDVYRDADIVINPVRAGGGLKIKNVEALCYEKVLITTTVGAAGMQTGLARSAFCVCDNPEDMASALIRLVESPGLRKSMAKMAREFASEMFSPANAYAELARVLT